MTLKVSYLFLVGSLVAIINGFALEDAREKRLPRNSMPEDCSKPPGRSNMKECCSLPRESIWGNLKPSFRLCYKNLQTMENEKRMSAHSEMNSTQSPDVNGKGKQHPYRRLGEEECFMECVFEDAGFLLEKKVNKDALLGRLKENLILDNQWLQVGTSAVEKCHLTLSNIRTNSTCMSGAAQIFHCIHKYIFLNCPTWLQNNDYCTSLKHFYQQCPDGPPPPIDEKRFEEELGKDSSELDKM